MRFLVDECTGPAVARWLREHPPYEVFSVYDERRRMGDDEILQKAYHEEWIIITNDKDFGEKVYRDHQRHRGIIVLRLEDERAGNKIQKIQQLLAQYAEYLPNRFIVVTEKQVRFARQ
jgi:predicted nuclease of predicted toxin-antitoxin system